MQRGSRDERGFTMVEMIITIAIMAILAGIIGGAYSIIKSGNASKSTSRFLGRLDTTQVENMTKKGTTYLYLFKDSDGVQTLMYNDGTDTGLNSQSDVIAHKADGVVTDIAGSGVDFTATSGSNSVNSKDTSDLVIKILLIRRAEHSNAVKRQMMLQEALFIRKFHLRDAVLLPME